eukprot:s675_g23.t1
MKFQFSGRLRSFFDFIEVCGGSGVLSEAMHHRGNVVGPIIDLTYSAQYDLVKWEVVEWLIWMIQNHRVGAVALEPPCTSFSPAAYPPVRSYTVPRGFNQKLPKVWFGNRLAFASLLLLYVAAYTDVIGWLETPRRSKMAWLSFWRFLLTFSNVEETYTASGSYGSPHEKEFRFLTCNMKPAGICRPCTRNHEHVRIQGQYTKGSAVYCPGLVEALAHLFDKHLKAKRRVVKSQLIDVSGLESVFVNEFVKRSTWETRSLAEGRPVEKITRTNRERLLEPFAAWLARKGIVLAALLEGTYREPEVLVQHLVLYGRKLFAAGRPYNHYVETVNGIAGLKPTIRRLLTGAWDLAFSWQREEPGHHHTACPFQILLAMCSACILWGWPWVAGALALSWGAVCRIGEVLAACRDDLIIPEDVGFTSNAVFLKVKEPKTRYRAARHQMSKLDAADLVRLVSLAFGKKRQHESCGLFLGSCYRLLRTRFKQLLGALGLPTTSFHGEKCLDLGSLRGGGATYLLMVTESPELVMRRGRWMAARTMDVKADTVQAAVAETEEAADCEQRLQEETQRQEKSESRLQMLGLSLQEETQRQEKSERWPQDAEDVSQRLSQEQSLQRKEEEDSYEEDSEESSEEDEDDIGFVGSRYAAVDQIMRGEAAGSSTDPVRPASLSLGRTSGITAAGAWAARFEVAAMLEARCDPNALVAAIRSGSEGQHILDMTYSSQGSVTRSTSEGSWQRVTPRGDSRRDFPDDMFSDDEGWEKEVNKQKAILDSLAGGAADTLPPWASSGAATSAAPTTGRGEGKEGKISPPSAASAAAPFVKKATPPPGMPPQQKTGQAPEKERDDKEEAVRFAKPAEPPPPPPPPDKPERGRRRRRDTDVPQSVAAMEAKDMSKFNKDCITVYDKLKKLRVEMEIQPLVEQGRHFDKDRFRLLTRPNRASTGLNYTRLMIRYLDWRSGREDLESGTSSDAKMGVLEFVEHLMQKQVGYLTPRSFLYAVDYFAGAFGFSMAGGNWNRARRLALSFAESKAAPTSRAPGFIKATLAALERCVMDPYLSKPERVACRKMRLCVQASTRYDDILNTPLSACEWVRRPGEKKVIGLRSRALRGKSGARLWVASLKGVDPANDTWLQELVSLLLESHGATWKGDDHMGKNSSGDAFIKSPAKLDRDVTLVKSSLEKLAKESTNVGMNLEEIEVLRWHGAKATLSSVMQHLNLPRRVVRWQGNWKSQAETMPDTYLRESQVLILGSQEKCLEYLRGGGDLVRLIGEPVGPGKGQEDCQAEEARRARAMAADFGDGADVDKLTKDFLDPAFKNGKISAEILAQEKASLADAGNLGDCLEEVDQLSPGYDPTSTASETEVTKAQEEEKKVTLPDPEQKLDEEDSEGLTPYWVSAKAMGRKPKVHLPSAASLEESPVTKAIPKCGASGTFELLKVEDPLDPSTKLCRRCSPGTEGACDEICSHVFLSQELTVYRCFRGCECVEEGHADHFCGFHFPRPKREGASS